ncbi:MAG: hypothetical protein LKM32_03830 [Chiayiivirga sp.]|uniref:hypothetical protein n=1 Tax=Chiayiivirga sp. TaxID=2041042 RepID=UPI0025BC972F|nr:hypothetical protein [Chiayiivirga sp.]MCI1728545.1 hypothetical protein [Chiayiivirga sp.]
MRRILRRESRAISPLGKAVKPTDEELKSYGYEESCEETGREESGQEEAGGQEGCRQEEAGSQEGCCQEEAGQEGGCEEEAGSQEKGCCEEAGQEGGCEEEAGGQEEGGCEEEAGCQEGGCEEEAGCQEGGQEEGCEEAGGHARRASRAGDVRTQHAIHALSLLPRQGESFFSVGGVLARWPSDAETLLPPAILHSLRHTRFPIPIRRRPRARRGGGVQPARGESVPDREATPLRIRKVLSGVILTDTTS